MLTLGEQGEPECFLLFPQIWWDTALALHQQPTPESRQGP